MMAETGEAEMTRERWLLLAAAVLYGLAGVALVIAAVLAWG